MKTNDQLKPCPLCGGKVECESAYSSVFEEIRSYIHCDYCQYYHWYRGISVFDLPNTERETVNRVHERVRQKTIEKWNSQVITKDDIKQAYETGFKDGYSIAKEEEHST